MFFWFPFNILHVGFKKLKRKLNDAKDELKNETNVLGLDP